MKIVTWNVNSIRVRETIVCDWLAANKPDVLLLQETKVTDDKFPREPFEAAGYHLAIHGQKSLNGVAIFATKPIEDVERALPGEPEDEQARYIEATVDGVRVASVYVPNGTKVGSDKFDYKLRFFERLRSHFARRAREEISFAVGGDYNVAPDPIDVYDAEDCTGDICYHPDERRQFRALVHEGYYDSFRCLEPSKRQFTWWDLRGGSWERDEGMRIDHVMLSPQATDRLSAVGADASTRQGKGVSDHIPLWCELGA